MRQHFSRSSPDNQSTRPSNKVNMMATINEDSFAAIKRLRATGLTILSVAKQTGWSFATVHRVANSDDVDGYRALNRLRYKANYKKNRERILAKRQMGALNKEEEIQRLYDSGHTTQQVCTKLKINAFAIEYINVTRRRDGKPPLWQKKVCRQEVQLHVSISNGIRKIAYLLDMVAREHQSLVTVQTDWCVEWDAGTAALQKGLASFRRRVNTSKKRSTK